MYLINYYNTQKMTTTVTYSKGNETKKHTAQNNAKGTFHNY